MKTLFIVALEPIEMRYTSQLFDLIPKLFDENFGEVRHANIVGDMKSVGGTSTGAFLDFIGTNIWKSQQCVQIAKLFSQGSVKDGDVFFFTDAWNPVCLQVKYMADLSNIKIKMAGIWHAGCYDPSDFLGRDIGSDSWGTAAELAMFRAYDVNYFGTNYHFSLFDYEHGDKMSLDDHKRVKIVGYPFDFVFDCAKFYKHKPIADSKISIVFPHRLAIEKNYDLFERLAQDIPNVEWITTQKMGLSKEAYYNVLADSTFTLSCSQHENLGISMAEAFLCGSIPIVPDDLSYHEIWFPEYKYQRDDSRDYESLLKGVRNAIARYQTLPSSYHTRREQQTKRLRQFFGSTGMLRDLSLRFDIESYDSLMKRYHEEMEGVEA